MSVYEGKHDSYSRDGLYDAGEAKYRVETEEAFLRERRSKMEKLMEAVNDGNLDALRDLVNAGIPIEIRKPDGTYDLTALHSAAYHGHLAICRYLVTQCRATVDARDAAGLTPLHRAAYNGKREICRYLLNEAGADLWCLDSEGLTPLQIAQRYGQTTTANELMDISLNRPPPHGYVHESGSVYEKSHTFKKAKELVGCRVQVFFKPKGAGMFGSKSWFDGTVVRYDEFKTKHFVKFDNGETKWIHFEFQDKPGTYRLLKATPTPPAGSPASIAVPMAYAVGESLDGGVSVGAAVATPVEGGKFMK